MFNIILI